MLREEKVGYGDPRKAGSAFFVGLNSKVGASVSSRSESRPSRDFSRYAVFILFCLHNYNKYEYHKQL